MAAIDELCAMFEDEGVRTEAYQLGGKPLADCLQCGKCPQVHRRRFGVLSHVALTEVFHLWFG